MNDNQREYVHKLSREVEDLRAGVKELSQASDILLRKVTMLYGGEDHTIRVPAKMDLDGWKHEVERDQDTGDLTIRMIKE